MNKMQKIALTPREEKNNVGPCELCEKENTDTTEVDIMLWNSFTNRMSPRYEVLICPECKEYHLEDIIHTHSA